MEPAIMYEILGEGGDITQGTSITGTNPTVNNEVHASSSTGTGAHGGITLKFVFIIQIVYLKNSKIQHKYFD